MSVVSISASEAVEHSASGDAVMVDMRPQVVRHQGSLPGAVVVEPAELSSAFAPHSCGRVGIDGFDTEIAVVSVPSEAEAMAERIASLGYTNVRYVDGGFPAVRPLT